MDDAATLRGMASLATPMALRVAVTLGLPDRLRADAATPVADPADAATPVAGSADVAALPGPAEVAALAAELDVAAVPLELLLGHLVTLGVLARTGDAYRTTEFGAHLCAGADGGLTNLLLDLDSAAGRSELAFVELLHSIRTGQAGYVRRYGRDFWSDAAEEPELSASFDRQMSLRLAGQIPSLATGYDWSRFGTVLDVGGGQGDLLAAILTAHPGVRGHLLDLAPTAERARRAFAGRGLAGRTEVTAGSFFDPLPAGAGACLLSDILHDWDDEHAHRILARCAEALPPGGRLLVVEPVGGLRAGTGMDLAMLVMYGGRERRAGEFRALAAAHGLTLDTVLELSAGRCLLEFGAAPDAA